MTPSAPPSASTPGTRPDWLKWLAIAGLVYLLLVAVTMIGSGFKAAAGDQARTLFDFASNPFAGLVIGTLATALIQSSSTVTSIIVGLVAGGMPVAIAVPMVMGANIGTSITNTLVSLGHVKDKEEFRRAFSAATVHDFFNLLSVVIFLPLEIMFGFLEKIGGWMAGLFVDADSMSMGGLNFVKPLTKPVANAFADTFAAIQSGLGLPEWTSGALLILAGIGLIFLAVTYIGRLMKTLMVGKAREILHGTIGRGPLSGIFSGTLITVLVQSSSTTTSLMVPLAGSGVFRVKDIYPFTLGANIGTCITALLAATAVSGEAGYVALQIAFVHLVYNVLGVVLIYGVPFLRRIPLVLCEGLATLSAERKVYGLSYILAVFFVVPGGLIVFTH
ncbi:Na/Pi symporter [Halomonas maura]|uniref:Na/Pi symporter n=1 Tax=Halomonas maura TaxID=117606 RepID=UPI0025B3738D|nr:Na/Pi symporter [Halomonas maura]MDN3555509.1 Na/Pi symporter [Halomonas maura]